MTLARCYSDDGDGAIWEKRVTSCGESWRRPLTEQMRAMFPHLCSYAKLAEMLSSADWYITTPLVCYQKKP